MPEILNKDEWKRVDRFPAPEPEGYGEAAVRHGARSASRIAETIGGLPKNALNFAESIYGMIPENLRQEGVIQKTIPGGTIAGPVIGAAYDIGKQFLPSSEQIKETIAQAAPTGYLEPQSQLESLSDELVSDFSALMFPTGPIGGAKALGKQALKAAGIVIPSTAAGLLAKKAGFGEKGQAGVKFGTALLTSMGMGASLKKQAQNTYEEIKASPLSKKTMRVGPISKITKDIEKDFLKKGRVTDVPEKELVKNIIGDFNGKVKRGRVQIADLAQFKQELSKDIERLARDKAAQQKVINLQSNINKLLKDQGYNKLADQFTKADELWTGASRGQKINDFVKNVVTDRFPNIVAFFGAMSKPGTFFPKVGQLAMGTGAGYVASHVANNIRNLITLPTLRNDYISLLGAAAKENAPLVLRRAEKLEKQLSKVNNQQSRQSREITDTSGWKKA